MMYTNHIDGNPKYRVIDFPINPNTNEVIDATFVHNKKVAKIFLEKRDYTQDSNGLMNPDMASGLRIEFADCKFNCANKAMFKKIMESKPFKDGRIRMNPEDPSGFWKLNGIIETEKVEIEKVTKINSVSYEAIDFRKVKVPKIQDEVRMNQ